MVVDAVMKLDADLNINMIGVKKESGGAMEDSILVDGVAFKKTFSYAGFEQQPKSFKNPKIICLNIELELKQEKENAEVRIEDPTVNHNFFFLHSLIFFFFFFKRNINRLLMLNGILFMKN